MDFTLPKNLWTMLLLLQFGAIISFLLTVAEKDDAEEIETSKENRETVVKSTRPQGRCINLQYVSVYIYYMKFLVLVVHSQ